MAGLMLSLGTPRRRHLIAGGVLALALITSALPAATAQAEPRAPTLRLLASAQAVTVDRVPGPILAIDLRTFMVADVSPFEVHVTRRSYNDPIEARQVIRHGNLMRYRPLGDDVVQRFGGFANFFQLSLRDAAGAVVVDTALNYCPGGDSLRLRPDAPDDSPYPTYCSWNPFTLGAVWGVQRGWGTATGTFLVRTPPGVVVPDGSYVAKLSIAPLYRSVFGIPDDTATVQITIRTIAPPPPHADHAAGAHGAIPQPNESEPTGPSRIPDGPRPDLISLPSWGIVPIGDNPRTPAVEPDLLTFGATIWNAGPSPLVVDGFRRAGEAVMDAYQYFYDDDGNQVGYAQTGEMEWDARDGHEHWHFRDFASYRLLNEDKQEVVRSHKESFCILATDAIDHFVRNAEWQSARGDLHSSCGGADALSLRQVLPVGTGDTYGQYLPGQAFEIQGLANGTYYIQIIANPNGALYESDTSNNTSLRKVILGGTPGQRTVQVPPYGLVDSERSSAESPTNS